MLTFSKGEIIFSDDPYATAVLEERLDDTCNWCFAHEFPDPLKCSDCSVVSYCSAKCRDKDSKYHALECQFLQRRPEDKLPPKRFALRALTRFLEEEKSNSPSVSYFFDQKCSFQDLVTHADRWDEDRLKEFRESRDELLQFVSERGVEISPEALLELIMKLSINGHCAKDDRSVNHVLLGQVLYLAGSRSDHSCEFQEDYIHLFKGNRTYIKALRDFSVSDALDIKHQYIPLQFSYAVRQDMLKNIYLFECECPRCIKESERLPPPFLTHIETFLMQNITTYNIDFFNSLEKRLSRFPNTNHFKNMLLTRLFLEGVRGDIEKCLSLAKSVLEGCQLITDRMKILYILCFDMASKGANKPSHEYHEEFKHYQKMALDLFANVFDENHPMVKEIVDFSVLKTEEGGDSSSITDITDLVD